MSDQVDILGVTGRDLPGVYQDNVRQAPRIGRRGEVYTQPLAGTKLYPLADEGSYFLASNPTIGTGIAGIDEL
jgi:hypothetical protein